MKVLLLVAAITICQNSFSQSEADSIIRAGIDLHDRGYYEEAIKKYDEVLTKDPKNYMANYEKAYTLSEWKKYDACIDICKFMLNEFKGNPQNKQVFVTYGSALDDQGKPEDAIKIFDDGLREFPDYYLLHFNKAITLLKQNKNAEAERSLQSALRDQPLHPSSHHILGRMMGNKRRIQATLSLLTFLVIEPESERAKQDLNMLNELMMKGISKNDNGNVTINIDADLLNKKNKPEEDDFSTAEFMLSLLGADNKVPDSIGAKTDADRLSYKMQMLIGFFSETKKNKKGFYKNFYVPMFIEMKKKNIVTTACYIAMTSADNSEITAWLNNNKEKVGEFYTWLSEYKWIKE